jgi:hypothetical protein
VRIQARVHILERVRIPERVRIQARVPVLARVPGLTVRTRRTGRRQADREAVRSPAGALPRTAGGGLDGSGFGCGFGL